MVENVTFDDRKIIREKMKAAYKKKSATFDELLELCASVEEEQIYQSAPSKLDYYKNGIHCVKRIFEKKSEIESGSNETEICAKNNADAEEAPKTLKRAKTQH